VTYYAHWTTATTNNYTVTWDANDGTGNTTSVNKDYNTPIGTLPTPGRTGYTFEGWYTDKEGGTKITESTLVTGNVTYYAHWGVGALSTSVPESEVAGIIGTLQPKQTIPLPKSVQFGDGHQSDVTWEAGAAGDTGKATVVDADGNLTGMTEGTVTLTATSKTDLTKKTVVKIMVAKNVTAVRTPVKTLYLVKKKTLKPPVAFDGKDVTGKAWGYGQTAKLTWKSSKTSVATVNPKTGKITAKKKVGTAKITATALNGKAKVTFTVKVVKKALKLKKVALKKPPKSLKKGKTAVRKVKLTSARATGVKVTFKSSKPSVLKVDKAGKLYAVKEGKAKITIKAGGKRKVITVIVKK
jgi:uncharacterized repeat protein (TIGR02543 family)